MAQTTNIKSESIVDELQSTMTGPVVTQSDARYADTRRVWNDAVQTRPAIIACCERASDVQAAVRAARRHGLPLTVRGGGHDWAGRALSDGGLTIDLTRMRDVNFDAKTETAVAGGGATNKDVIDAATAHGRLAVVGNCGAVGMAGLTLGGGYSPLSGKFGLAADNLLGAEVVLADGRLVTTDDANEPDLFWALRGGGGNFGVVTSLTIQLHRANDILGGSIVYPLSEAGKIVQHYVAVATALPEEFGISFAMMSTPDGRPGLAAMPLWNGKKERGEQVLRGLQRFGNPYAAKVGPMSYGEVLALSDPVTAYGFHVEVRTRWLPALTADAIEVMAAAATRKTSPYSTIIFNPFLGAGTRVAPEATAFGMRREHFMLGIGAHWKADGDEGSSHRQWTHELWQNLAPFALRGGYANLLGIKENGQARDAYGGNGTRLKAVKRRFDPDNVFASAIPLPHAGESHAA